jgi:acrylyl-CoA reductase (NADPH)
MSDSFKALVLEESDGAVTPAIRDLGLSDLPAGNVTVAIDYSDLNYKDGMVVRNIGRLVRTFPHVPGVDFAGTVETSESPDFRPGDRIVLTGWRVGEAHWGGYAQKARVDAGWLVPLPDGLSAQQAMAVGTAGFTAMLAIDALEAHGLEPGTGDVLVTGAAGGVGSVAVAILAQRGYQVVASTGRAALADYLRDLGAATVIDRREFSGAPPRPLERERWAGCVDSVGSTTLAMVLAQMKYGCSVAACGLAAGNDLPASVIPFLLRGVNLLGIDSVMQPAANRARIWQRIATELSADRLAAMTQIRPLTDVPHLADEILKGAVRGRVVIDVNA